MDGKALNQTGIFLAVRKIVMKSIFSRKDASELFPNPEVFSISSTAESTGMRSESKGSAFSSTLKEQVAFPLSSHRHGSVVHLPSEKGRKEHGPFGGASSSCKGRGEGIEGFSLKNSYFQPLLPSPGVWAERRRT